MSYKTILVVEHIYGIANDGGDPDDKIYEI